MLNYEKLYLKIISNYRYLVQLVMTCFIFLLILCVVVLYFSLYRSFEKLQAETRTFYMSATQNFADYFLAEIESAVTLTNQIGIHSRTQGNGMDAEVQTNALQVELIESSPYYFKAATDSLAYYRNNENDVLEGIYYPEQDWLITSTYKFTAYEYVRDFLQIKDEKEQDGIGTTSYLRSWFEKNFPKASLLEGMLVSSVNDIRESYQSCRREKKSSDSAGKTALLAAEILQFLQENFSNPDINQNIIHYIIKN